MKMYIGVFYSYPCACVNTCIIYIHQISIHINTVTNICIESYRGVKDRTVKAFTQADREMDGKMERWKWTDGQTDGWMVRYLVRPAAAGSHVRLFDRDVCHRLMRGLVDLRCMCIRIFLLCIKSTWPGHMHASLCVSTYTILHICARLQYRCTCTFRCFCVLLCACLCVCVVSVMSY